VFDLNVHRHTSSPNVVWRVISLCGGEGGIVPLCVCAFYLHQPKQRCCWCAIVCMRQTIIIYWYLCIKHNDLAILPLVDAPLWCVRRLNESVMSRRGQATGIKHNLYLKGLNNVVCFKFRPVGRELYWIRKHHFTRTPTRTNKPTSSLYFCLVYCELHACDALIPK